MDDLAVVIVSYGSAHWLPACLRTIYARAGDIALDVAVADNDPGVDVPPAVAACPPARIVPCENHGFGHANNVAARTCDARYVLFLNPDTELLEGTLADLVRIMDARPNIGLAGAVQRTPDGAVFPTSRRFPGAARALAEAVGAERFPIRRWPLGERMLDMRIYQREHRCDWTSGSFMLVRREALEGVGLFDERFFMFGEEVDLAYRIHRGGWEIWHLPQLEILHFAKKAGLEPKREAQEAFSRAQYARKHFTPGHRLAYLLATGLRYALRGALGGMTAQGAEARRAVARRACRALLPGADAPYQPPPPVATRPAIQGQRSPT